MLSGPGWRQRGPGSRALRPVVRMVYGCAVWSPRARIPSNISTSAATTLSALNSSSAGAATDPRTRRLRQNRGDPAHHIAHNPTGGLRVAFARNELQEVPRPQSDQLHRAAAWRGFRFPDRCAATRSGPRTRAKAFRVSLGTRLRRSHGRCTAPRPGRCHASALNVPPSAREPGRRPACAPEPGCATGPVSAA